MNDCVSSIMKSVVLISDFGDDFLTYLNSHPAVSCAILVVVLAAAGLADCVRRSRLRKNVRTIRCRRCNYVGLGKFRLGSVKLTSPKCESDDWVTESPRKVP